MTCNIQMSAFGNIQSATRKKIYFFFGPGDLLYSNDAHREIASRHGEESCRSSKESFCKSNLEERFAHRREICDSGKPLKRGLLKRPILIKTPTSGAFGRTSAFRPPPAYFNRQASRGRETGRTCAVSEAEGFFRPPFSPPTRGGWPSPRLCTRSRRPPSCRRVRVWSASPGRSRSRSASAPASPRPFSQCTTTGTCGSS